MTGRKHTTGTKELMSTTRLGDKHPMFGNKHREETKKLMSIAQSGELHPMFGKKWSEEKKAELSLLRKGRRRQEKNPMFGKNHSEDTKAKMAAAKKGIYQKIEVTNVTTNQTTIYESLSAAALAIDLHTANISTFLSRNQQKPFKGIYIFKKV